MQKPAVRDHGRDAGLDVAAKPDSQEICFIPGGDYAAFLARLPRRAGPADARHRRRARQHLRRGLGTHTGIHNFTVGQRKGLGLTSPTRSTSSPSTPTPPRHRRRRRRPPHPRARRRSPQLDRHPRAHRPMRVRAKIRHRHEPAAATLTPARRHPHHCRLRHSRSAPSPPARPPSSTRRRSSRGRLDIQPPPLKRLLPLRYTCSTAPSGTLDAPRPPPDSAAPPTTDPRASSSAANPAAGTAPVPAYRRTPPARTLRSALRSSLNLPKQDINRRLHTVHHACHLQHGRPDTLVDRGPQVRRRLQTSNPPSRSTLSDLGARLLVGIPNRLFASSIVSSNSCTLFFATSLMSTKFAVIVFTFGVESSTISCTFVVIAFTFGVELQQSPEPSP